jgi:hypothetical protein
MAANSVLPALTEESRKQPLFLGAIARLHPVARYTMFALPMMLLLLLGACYLAYSKFVCDPLYTNDESASGYQAGSSVSALRALLPPDYISNTALPVPRKDFGATCK